MSEEIISIEQELISELSEKIRNKNMQMPIRLLLEMHLPLAGIGLFCFQLLKPFLGLVISAEKLEILSTLLAKPKALELLINKLEE